MLVNGKLLAESIIRDLPKNAKRIAFILFKDEPSSRSFIARKMKVAESLGITAKVIEKFETNTAAALEIVRTASEQNDAVVVQLPLPENIDGEEIINSIPVEKDVDMLGDNAKIAYMKKETDREPPVAGAVAEILRSGQVSLYGKKVVVLGKGKLVGEPVWMWLRRNGIDFEIFDKYDSAARIYTALKEADIVISGIGSPHHIKPEMLKEGVVLIDAGTSEQEGKLLGDVDPACESKASLLTPVPGGVGPLTVAVLYRNLLIES